ncbi:MAG: hypothetical protein WCR46_08575 [Deltaproteobacteria bacterium]|jgi:hypothetical protein
MKISYCLTRYIYLAAIILLAGCATYPPLQTPSGRPEVSIHGAAMKDILNVIVDQMSKDGWRIKSLQDNRVVVVSSNDKWEMILAYGSPLNEIPENQITFTLVDAGDNEVRVLCSGVVVTNPGGGFENVAYIVGGKFYARAQSELEKLKLKMEK